MRKSEEYYFDTVKNVGVGLIVASGVAFFLQPQAPILSLIAMLLSGIFVNAYGYHLLARRDREE